MEAEVPDKIYFKIGEVAKITSLKPSVLRYWESEFSALNPAKSWSGQRMYNKKHLDVIFEIKRLLYLEKMTIEGARKKLDNRRKGEDAEERLARVLAEVRDELGRIRDSL